MLSHGVDRALQARLANAKILAKLGFNGDVPMPDISTKAKAQKYIGLDMNAEHQAKDKFMKEIVPQWLQKAKSENKIVAAN